MPIGLPDSSPRACDLQARAFLGSRRSSVFPAPPRACLEATDYADALARCRTALGVGLSLQAFHLLPKIREVDALVSPADDRCVAEVHPECAFLLLNEMEPLPPKRTPEGAQLRRELLTRLFGPLPAVPRGARPDDLLDAFAVLWSAERFSRGEHLQFGDGSRDQVGLPMRIVC